MATSVNPKNSIDPSLWFDSFSTLLIDLENLPISSDPPISLVEKLKESRIWFLNLFAQFKAPSQLSKDALNLQQVVIGPHKLNIQPQFKELALKLSSIVCLDEIQSYILVERCLDHNTLVFDDNIQRFLYEVVLQYYTERQCLLKCIRQMIIHALNVESAEKEGKVIWHEVNKLFSDGLEGKSITSVGKLLSSSFPEHMDVDLFGLWAEEILIENKLVLDLLFLAYYESICTCSAAKWKDLCMLFKDMTAGSSNLVKLGVSAEAIKYSYQIKIQMLLILIETLNFENLLQMLHDDVPFRDGSSVFSSGDILEMDSVISRFDVFEAEEVGLLILAWASYLCLVTSLPRKEEHNELMDIDHVGYVHQAFEVGSLNRFLEILQTGIVNDSDGPVAGYRSILRTFISAFVASYEINIQPEDDTFRLILAILCEIFRGEESLCVQFWDKYSIVDEPIRCLLRNVEGEFPIRVIELTQFLSALSEGSWPAECVFNYMEKSVGISSVLDIGTDLSVGGTSRVVETQLPLHIPAVEGLFIPSKTRGHILRMIDSQTAVVRWEHKQSGLLVLLLRLAQAQECDGKEEIPVVLDLFSQLASFNTAVCFKLMNIGKLVHVQTSYGFGEVGSSVWIDIIQILCNIIRNLSPYCGSVLIMSRGVNIMANMMKCSPSHVSMVVKKMDIFDLSLKTSTINDWNDDFLSGSYLLSGRLAKMLLIDCEHIDGCPLTISVLEFTMQLLKTGVDNDLVLALVIFCFQYVLVNHEYWKYKVKHDRWKVTLKVLHVLKISIVSVPYLTKIGGIIRNIILSDHSIHSMFFRIVCTTSAALEKLYVSRVYDWKEIDGLQRAIQFMLDISVSILSYPEGDISGLSIIYQAILSTSTKPVPVVVALASLMSYFREPAIQVGAAAALSELCLVADLSRNANFGLDSKQVVQLRHSIETIITNHSERNEELFITVIKLFASAANHQPAFFAALFAGEEISAAHLRDTSGLHEQKSDSTSQLLKSENATCLIDKLVLHVEKCDMLIGRNPRILLSILHFMKVLWQGATVYSDILESIRKSKKFWEKLSECIMLINHKEAPSVGNLSETEAEELACLYQCQTSALDIMALEIFLQKKLLHAESLVRPVDESLKGRVTGGIGTETQPSTNWHHLDNILSSWSEGNSLSSLLNSFTVCICNTDIYSHAKFGFGLLVVHLIAKLATGDDGSLTVSFKEQIAAFSKKLINLPAFVELCSHYAQHGYSEGTEIKSLILSDLYYHMQGELDGRDIENGLFRELSRFVVDSKLLQAYQKGDHERIGQAKIGHLFDILRLRHDIGLDNWDFSEWKASKHVAETMLLHLHTANSMLLVASSRLPSLRAFITILTLGKVDLVERESTFWRISGDKILSCINKVCEEFSTTVGLLSATSDAPQEILDFVAAQAELLLCLAKHADGDMPSAARLTILKTCSFGLKYLCESRLLVTEIKLAIRFLLILLLMVVKLSCMNIPASSTTNSDSASFGEVSNICLGLLPVLCRCTEVPDHIIISLAVIDMMVKRLLAPSTWLPVIQQHLQLQLLTLKLHDKRNFEYLPVILKFLLTLSGLRVGAEMLLASGFLSSLRVLFAETSDGGMSNMANKEVKSAILGSKHEKPLSIWGLGLAVFTAIVSSLGESSLNADTLDNVIFFFLSEKAHLIDYHLRTPDFPSDDHDKKRARSLKTQTPLSVLRETEHTLTLIIVLAKHQNPWVKVINETGSDIQERLIHLLAFFSRINLRLRESTTRSSLACVPISKDEIDSSKRPPFVNSRNGWFGASAGVCIPTPFVYDESLRNAVVVKGPANEHADSLTSTYFSDTVALQIYRNTFLILNFLCLQADCATRRAEEHGFVDLSHFPELPDPEVLHGLQDQSFAIVTEVCEANRSKQIQPETQSVCHLLLNILEMALYLELSVSQICGIRPVLGRVEDFSKQVRSLVKATEGQEFLIFLMKNLKQIVALMYPGLLQSEGIL